MNCVATRDLLPEFALGLLPDRDQAALDEHLRECAGCRKEAADLGQAAATFALAQPQATLPAGLDDRVLAGVHRAAGRAGSRRRFRPVAAVALAAAVAMAGLGWGAVMAGRAQRFADRAAQAEQQRQSAFEQFQKVLSNLPFQAPADETHLGMLAPTSAISTGGGAALQLVSPTHLDFVIVMVKGLPKDPALLPYSVTLRNADGRVLRAGRISRLDADGGGEDFHQFQTADLTGFSKVLVRDATGRVVLSGTVDQGTS